MKGDTNRIENNKAFFVQKKHEHVLHIKYISSLTFMLYIQNELPSAIFMAVANIYHRKLA